MDAIRKVREQLAKQQQAVIKTFTPSNAPQHSETVITDEEELQRHHQLERLYGTTKAGKHFQREIVKCVDGMVQGSTKQQEHSSALAEACRRFGTEGPAVGQALGKATLVCSAARSALERERENCQRALGTQVVEPLKSMINGAPLDDARMLTQRYDKLRSEAEAQSAQVTKLQNKAREGGANHPENAAKAAQAEQRMSEITSSMAVLGKEAAAAMIAVEIQQQRLTLQRLIAMVEAERTFHQRAGEILDQLQAQMILERQRSDAAPATAEINSPFAAAAASAAAAPPPPSYEDSVRANGSQGGTSAKKAGYFLAEVMHAFRAEGDGELTLTVGDYLVVRQIAPTGWAEGELRGKAGWFPAAYVERRQKVPASKVIDARGL